MRFIWGVFCKRPLIDEKSKALSVIDIPESLILHRLPPELPAGQTVGLAVNSTYVADFWLGEKDEPRMDVRLLWLTPKGERMEVGTTEINYSNETRGQRVRLFLTIEKLGYHGLGVYELELETRSRKSKKWLMVASFPIEIVLKVFPILLEQPSAPTPAAPPVSSSPIEPSRPSNRPGAPRRRRRRG